MEFSKERIERFIERIPFSGCWLWIGVCNKGGYGKLKISHSRSMAAHRYAYQAYGGEIQNGLCVCHRCDTPSCVNPDHLFVGTMTDNMRDRHAKGRTRWCAGSKNGNAKITVEQVREIMLSTSTAVQTAKVYGLHESTVRAIWWKARYKIESEGLYRVRINKCRSMPCLTSPPKP